MLYVLNDTVHCTVYTHTSYPTSVAGSSYGRRRNRTTYTPLKPLLIFDECNEPISVAIKKLWQYRNL